MGTLEGKVTLVSGSGLRTGPAVTEELAGYITGETIVCGGGL